MTRVYVYSSALVVFTAATAMLIASIYMPHWISYAVESNRGETIDKHIGLHKSCSSLDDPHCRDFPYPDMCQHGERYLCSMWRTVGFMASFATILCLACLVSFGVIMGGGKYKRETGWPFVSAMLTLVSVVEFIIISIVAYLFDNDEQFALPGWHLDKSWYLSTVSAAITLLSAGGLALSAYLLPPDDGYDFLEDPLDA
jgi:amino acid transporter